MVGVVLQLSHGGPSGGRAHPQREGPVLQPVEGYGEADPWHAPQLEPGSRDRRRPWRCHGDPAVRGPLGQFHGSVPRHGELRQQNHAFRGGLALGRDIDEVSDRPVVPRRHAELGGSPVEEVHVLVAVAEQRRVVGIEHKDRITGVGLGRQVRAGDREGAAMGARRPAAGTASANTAAAGTAAKAAARRAADLASLGRRKDMNISNSGKACRLEPS